MRAPIGLVATALLASCGLMQPLPSDVVLAAAEPMFDVGHPMADFDRAEIAGSSSGSFFGGGSHDRYVDLDVHYHKGATTHRMRVRLYVHSMEPCHITTDVLEDTGPPPVLLDNGIASEEVGRQICLAMEQDRNAP